jgi:hypothetical protein
MRPRQERWLSAAVSLSRKITAPRSTFRSEMKTKTPLEAGIPSRFKLRPDRAGFSLRRRCNQ